VLDFIDLEGQKWAKFSIWCRSRETLTALKVATTLTVAVPTAETGWKIASIRCTDTNAAVSGNPLPPTILVSSTNNTVVIPANVVSAAAALQCAVIGSRQL